MHLFPQYINSNRTRFSLIAAIGVLALTSCGAPHVLPTKKPAPVPKPIIVVKIDDTNDAHPQIGIEKADLIYIEQVEGGLVRLAAVFNRTVPAQIGPVRSARISDIDLVAQFGKVGFFYSGAQSKFLPVLRAANLFDLGAERESPKLYTRDRTRFAPYDLILQGDELQNRIATLDIVKSTDLGLNQGANSATGMAIKSVKVKWPAVNYRAEWNGSTWTLYHNGNLDLAADGSTLAPPTFVIQKVVITPSIYHDREGGVTPFSATVGQGSGWVLRDGIAIAATWNRPDAASVTTWSDAKGNQIKFAKGQVWVALTDQEPEFTAAAKTK